MQGFEKIKKVCFNKPISYTDDDFDDDFDDEDDSSIRKYSYYCIIETTNGTTFKGYFHCVPEVDDYFEFETVAETEAETSIVIKDFPKVYLPLDKESATSRLLAVIKGKNFRGGKELIQNYVEAAFSQKSRDAFIRMYDRLMEENEKMKKLIYEYHKGRYDFDYLLYKYFDHKFIVELRMKRSPGIIKYIRCVMTTLQLKENPIFSFEQNAYQLLFNEEL